MKTLLVDTNRAAYPIYDWLCSLGHEVWVVGGLPVEPLAKLSSNYVQLDYSDTARLAELIEREGFDHVVPGCTDLSYKACVEVGAACIPGIDSPEVNRAINDKGEFRRLAEQVGLPVPAVLDTESAVSVESVIVKPVDSFSGRGMTVLHHASCSEIAAAHGQACKASKSGSAIIEEFVTGQLFSHSAFVDAAGEIVADFVVREDCTTNPFTVDTSKVVTDFPAESLALIRDDVKRLAKAMTLPPGLVHSQFILKENKHWFIEVTRRCPGDLYSLLIEFSTGYPYAASYAAPFLGMPHFHAAGADQCRRIIRHTVTSKEGESLWGFQFAQPVDIRLFVPLSTAGDYIGPSPYGRAGIFFFETDSKEEHAMLYKSVLTRSLFNFSVPGSIIKQGSNG